MFDMLLKVKEEYLEKEQSRENSKSFDQFSEHFAEYEERLKLIEGKPNNEQLFGIPFKS